MDSKRNLGVIILAIAMITLTAAILFNPWGKNDVIGPNETAKLLDKIILFIALIIMYVSLVLVFISCQEENIDYLAGLYAVIVIINILITFSYNVSYGVLLLLVIALVVVLIIITRTTKKYYLIIAIVVLIAALLSQSGLYL